MAPETNELYGPKTNPGEGDHSRTGKSPSRALVNGERDDPSKNDEWSVSGENEITDRAHGP